MVWEEGSRKAPSYPIYGNLSELGRYNPVNENSRNRAFGLGAPYLHLMEGLRLPGQMDKLVEPAGTTAVP